MPLSSLADRADEYEPMLPKSYGALTLSTTSSTAARAGPTYYGGFSQQKRVWASTARRSRRLRVLATTQLVLGTLSLFNYLWISNSFTVVVGAVGLVAAQYEATSWAVVYLLVCALEFARVILLAPRIYERFSVPGYHFTGYEYFQVIALVAEEAFLIPAAAVVVVAAALTSLSRARRW